MYDKVANYIRNHYEDSSDLSSEDVENYLRHGDMTYISAAEAALIEDTLDKFL